MLRIKEGEPWVMWPNNIVPNFINYPANRIFDFDGNFVFKIIFELDKPIINKSTLFSKLPSYFGVDLESNGITFILSDINGFTQYHFNDYTWEIDKRYELIIKKNGNSISYYINNILLLNIFIENKLSEDDNSHIIFGAGNFPKNNYNLNYFSLILHEIEIKKEGVVICKHDFKKIIHNKSFDLTNNCNFINKI